MRIKLTSIMVDNQDKALRFTRRRSAFGRNTTFPWGPTNGRHHHRGVLGHCGNLIQMYQTG